MSAMNVRTEDMGPVRHVIISRAEKRNALSSRVYGELGEAFAEVPVSFATTKRR
jgi:enoyl-CoA hydratase/carnithine racemase